MVMDTSSGLKKLQAAPTHQISPEGLAVYCSCNVALRRQYRAHINYARNRAVVAVVTSKRRIKDIIRTFDAVGENC